MGYRAIACRIKSVRTYSHFTLFQNERFYGNERSGGIFNASGVRIKVGIVNLYIVVASRCSENVLSFVVSYNGIIADFHVYAFRYVSVFIFYVARNGYLAKVESCVKFDILGDISERCFVVYNL